MFLVRQLSFPVTESPSPSSLHSWQWLLHSCQDNDDNYDYNNNYYYYYYYYYFYDYYDYGTVCSLSIACNVVGTGIVAPQGNSSLLLLHAVPFHQFVIHICISSLELTFHSDREKGSSP